MGDVRAFVLAIVAILIGLGLFLGWINYKIDKLKEEDKLNIDIIGSIITLEKAMKKLNAALKIHDRRLDNHLHEISDIKDRLDILESGHPDSDIDYATLDDHDEVVEVWFEGKKYVPEDTRAEETNTFYADNKVVAETTRPEETRCCATCQYYRPESGYSTCDLRTWLHVTKKYATMTDSACNNYEKTSAVLVPSDKDKVEYIRYDRMYKNLGGNGMTEQLLKRAERLDYIYSTGLMSIATYRHMVDELLQEELTHNDT